MFKHMAAVHDVEGVRMERQRGDIDLCAYGATADIDSEIAKTLSLDEHLVKSGLGREVENRGAGGKLLEQFIEKPEERPMARMTAALWTDGRFGYAVFAHEIKKAHTLPSAARTLVASRTD
jgi:hypothetical protein